MGSPTSFTAELAKRHVPVDSSIPLGSGGRFKKLKSKLAARGARNPGALAAYIGRRAYGRKKFASLGAKGRSHAHANTGPALEFTVPDAPAFPVTGPLDLMITRDPGDGSAVVRHRRGGGEIGRIKHSDDGQWRAARDGKDLQPHTRQRGALLELIGVHNTAAPSPYRRQPAPPAEPLQPRSEQTPLMKAYGIPAITLAAATPTVGAADGPKITKGLGQRGTTIYKKLRSRGFPHERAHSFARRAERKAAG